MEDMTQYPHLQRAKRSGNLQYRRRIPSALRATFDGKYEVKKSFGTTVLAEALTAYHEMAADTERKIVSAKTIQSVAEVAPEATPLPELSAAISKADSTDLLDRIFEAHRDRCRQQELRERAQLKEAAQRDPGRLRNGELMLSSYAFNDPLHQIVERRRVPPVYNEDGSIQTLQFRGDLNENRSRSYEHQLKWIFCLTAGTTLPANQERR